MGPRHLLAISGPVTSEVWRRLMRRFRSSSLYAWRYRGGTPEGLEAPILGITPADDRLATEFYSGLYKFAGESVSVGGETPFVVEPPSPEWFAELHSFRWLRHLRAANTQLVQSHSNALMADWIDLWGDQISSLAWRTDIVAARLISWLTHAPLLLRNTSDHTYAIFLRSLGRQTRFLKKNAQNSRDGYPRLHVAIALAYASLCLKGRDKDIATLAADLDKEIERQILSDGGHISRNPEVLVHILCDLLPLKSAYAKRGHRPSQTLVSAIDRMMAALRFFRHSNGKIAQFNGAGHVSAHLLNTMLRYSDSQGEPQQSAPHTGYERLSASGTVVLMDTGKPITLATATQAHGGTLSFEMSCGAYRFVVNCGVPENGVAEHAPYTRETAAHSTLSIGGESSSEFSEPSRLAQLLPTPMTKPPVKIGIERWQEDGFHVLRANHDGYAGRFGLLHERTLFLSEDGGTLNGMERLVPTGTGPRSDAEPTEHAVAIRFHFPTSVKAFHLTSGHSVLVSGAEKDKDQDGWMFTCVDGRVELAESIQFSGPGSPRRTQQIVVHATTATSDIRWTLMRQQGETELAQSGQEEDPPSADLLDGLPDDGSPHTGDPSP